MKNKQRLPALGLALACAFLLPAAGASAAVIISTNPTENMSCSDGVCSPTAGSATLNVTDLADMLAASDLKVRTASGALDLRVDAAFSWTSANGLTLEANRNLAVGAAVSVAGPGNLTLALVPLISNGSLQSPKTNLTNAAGAPSNGLTFVPGGSITFWDLNSHLVINRKAYKLINTLQTLRHAIRIHPDGYFALAADYDALQDGTYTSSPVRLFRGTLEGLGNVVSNLSVSSTGFSANVGMFGETVGGAIRDLGLIDVSVSGTGMKSDIGGLVGKNGGLIDNCFVTGSVSSAAFHAGAVAGFNDSRVVNSHATAQVTGVTVGGLVGDNGREIDNSYATGKVIGLGDNAFAGGLVGASVGRGGASVLNSWAAGSVSGSSAGGLVGLSYFTGIQNAYATGAVDGTRAGGLVEENSTGGLGASYSTGMVGGTELAGGLIGNASGCEKADCYWDLDTSGISDPSQGCGGRPNCFGVTGLNDHQLKSALPAGFDPAIWGQDPNINSGYPYLLANPPPN